MRKFIYTFFRKIISPFVDNIHHFLALWILASLVDFIAFCFNHSVAFACYYALHGFLIVYLCVLIGDFLKGKFRKVYFILLYVFGFINLIADTVCELNFGFKFTADTAEIIKATNAGETYEFFVAFFSVKTVIVIVLVLLLAYLVWRFREKILEFSFKYSQISGCMGLGLCILIIVGTAFRGSSHWTSIYINKIALFVRNENRIDLQTYRHSLSFEADYSKLPEDIVIIIGESHSRRHTSLYGYTYETTPLIQERVDNEEVIVFADVTSPGLNTIPCFKEIFNNKISDNLQIDWFKCSTIFDIADALDMKSYWISNQDRKGMYDNIPTAYSMLCDSVLFAGKDFMVAGRISQDGNYDDNVLDLYDELEKSVGDIEKGRNMFVFHLMGSHHVFQYRYPASFSYFDKTDYMDKLEHQRATLATYDNSILYNDYVVDQIIRRFEDKDAIVIYFSDHALDIYDSSDSYFGHAKPDLSKSIEAGKAIPFWIYTSPTYKLNHPDRLDNIKRMSFEPFCTNVFYSKLLEILSL